jgi:large subunit ribosomal protein L29
MKKGDFRKMKDMTLVELQARGNELRQEMFKLRRQQAGSQLESPARLRLLRRDIARIETLLSAKKKQAA